ncbi:acetolactate synthase large subunit [Marinobacter persicus]|uniref:Acetolactate synthase-1/2/3 large subunit n=1 Tax=Marinobacter persicus TaxID=930118 RepID=A0A2S6G565_9GAMM|nr:acetolactate synthase large subunit [Marinobacter persicus]PPK50815.1 acetolactate synthase-1/2/3 large subunit [Marinobacter persicus]PPK54267.1 acetolactate synthase-1/2/3 large subunit [Marinobacter persicus]PPK57403.1 acetolactate synthase-1/2/3 large subunit [Marinobacter persicus]
MKASDLLVKALENEGVEYIFAVPGEENLDLLNSLKDSSIRLIVTRHEQGAGFMAATLGRITEKTGVCLATLGPGATNLVTPAAFARLGAMPMLMITGQKPIKSSKQGRFQILDVVDLMQPVTRFTRQIVNGNTIAPLVREAFRLSMEERPASVHLELPEDIAREDCDDTVFEVVGHRMPAANDKSLAEAVAMIEAAKSPLVLIGAGANRKRVCSALTDFVDATGIPFFTTQMGKGVIDERHPLYLGTAALSANDFIHCAIDHSDLVINVGHDVVEKPPFIMEHGGKKVIHINFCPAEVDAVYFPQLNVVGDIALSLKNLGQQIRKQDHWDLSYFEAMKKEVDTHLSRYFEDDRFPMLPQRLVNLLRSKLDDGAILSLDNGIYKVWFARNYKCYKPNTMLLDNALASMGAGLPSAIAAKIARPDSQVVAICGDGGFMMNSQELETAVRLELDLVVIVLNDNAFGMIKWKQEGMGFDDYGLDYSNPKFVDYARSYGANGYLATSDDHFQETLDHCLASPGVHLIELPVDYSLNHRILNVLLKEKACQV